MMTTEQIREAYGERNVAWMNAKTDAYEAGLTLASAKEELAFETANATLDGRITGKNAEAREAEGRRILGELYEAEAEASAHYNEAKHRETITHALLEEVRVWIRLAEIDVARAD